MGKGNKAGVAAGNAAAKTNAATGSTLQSKALTLQDTLEPELQADISNPQGYGQPAVNAMNTAAQQSAGGATAGLVGQGNLQAARTGNRGAFTAAADQAARSGAQATSQRAVEIQGANAKMQQEQRGAALKAQQGLFGSDLSGSLQAMGLVPGDINAATSSEGPGVLDWITGLSGAASSAGTAAAGFKK